MSIVEIHQNGHWVPAAEFELLGKPGCATFSYLPSYVFGDYSAPASLALPVIADRCGVSEGGAPLAPAFLFDLVPQGRGRSFLLGELGLRDGDDAHLSLVQFGAFNPVGNLRIDTAVRFYRDRVAAGGDGADLCFAFEDIVRRRENFLEHIWMHAMLHAGTTGLQGAAPKFLLTQNRDGLRCADAALPDQEASCHWLVKLPRGRKQSDEAVLRNEAAYLRVARACGLRTHEDPTFENNMLFVRRFDRAMSRGSVVRLHQESLASLVGIRSFGLSVSHFDLVRALMRHVTNPCQELVEYLKRDILNLAMRNTDNHARNTAVQALENGVVQLTPVFDFAPMYHDSEMVLRGCRWQKGGKIFEKDGWASILDEIDISCQDKTDVSHALTDFADMIGRLPEIMRDCGVDDFVIQDCAGSIGRQYEQLNDLYGQAPKAF